MGIDTDVVGGGRESALIDRLVRGAIAGIVGGVIFGMLMAMMGMLPMVASLIGSDSAAVGFGLHMVFSAIIGAGYGLVLGTVGDSYGSAWWAGLVYGVAWWILGPLLIMPTMMGMGSQFGMAFQSMNLMSLMGHLIYGLVTAYTYAFLTSRAR